MKLLSTIAAIIVPLSISLLSSSCSEEPQDFSDVKPFDPFDTPICSPVVTTNGLANRMMPLTDNDNSIQRPHSIFNADADISFLARIRNTTDKTIHLYGSSHPDSISATIQNLETRTTWVVTSNPNLNFPKKGFYSDSINPGDDTYLGIILANHLQIKHSETGEIITKLPPAEYKITATWKMEDDGSGKGWVGEIKTAPLRFVVAPAN